MRPWIALLVVVASVSVPGAASAAWSTPQTLSSPHLFIIYPEVVVGGSGGTMATWDFQDGLRSSARSGSSAAARATTTSPFGAEQVLARGRTPAEGQTALVGVAAFARSRALLLTQTTGTAAAQRAHPGRTSLEVTFSDTAGRFGASSTIVSGSSLRGAQLAAGDAGDAVVTWFEDRGVSTDRVYVAVRRAGGRFGAPVLVATDRVRSVSAAISPRGDVLVTWDARGRLHTRTRRAGARGFGSVQTIPSAPTYFATLRTAVTSTGRAYVAWTSQLLTEGGSSGPFYAEVAVRPAGATRFRAAQLLERAQDASQAGVDLALDGQDATFVWAGRSADHRRIRASRTDASARFGPAQDVSPPDQDAIDPTVAVRGGVRVVAWTEGGGDSGGRIGAAFAPARQPFGAPEPVAPGPQSEKPDVALSPAGVPTVVWSDRPAGSGGPIAGIRTFAEASSRLP